MYRAAQDTSHAAHTPSGRHTSASAQLAKPPQKHSDTAHSAAMFISGESTEMLPKCIAVIGTVTTITASETDAAPSG